MKSTPNYNLVKQELTDAADITQISGNWDKLDTTLKNLDDNKFNKTGGTISGQVTVTGRSNFYSVQVTDTETVGGTLTVGGKVTANGGLGVSGGATVDSLTATGDVTVNGKINTDNIRARGTALNAGVTMSGSDFVGVIAQVVSGTTPRISVSHHPDKTSNDKQIATTNWVKSLTATTSEYGLVKVADETALLSESNDAALTVDKAYELNDFRRMNKAYVVGDKVNCAFRFEWFLECIQAGTTSNETLDTRNVTFGQEITDGTVKWVVRAHVKSVNNAVPDKNGNINVEIGDIKTINGNKPDSNGNITPEQTGCLPLTGNRTVTGTIYSNGNISRPVIAYCANAGNTSGNVTEGGQLWLFSKDDPNYKGGFILRTIDKNSNQVGDLQGTNDGSLLWRGYHVAITNTDVNIPGYIKIRTYSDDRSLALIWGEFTDANRTGVIINLPIPIRTMVMGIANPVYSSGANNHVFVRQYNQNQILISTGEGDSTNRSGQWCILAHINFN